MINFAPISNVVGVLLIIIGVLMFSALPFSWYYHSNDAEALFFSGGITILCGLLLWLARFGSGSSVNKREGYLIVSLGWLAMVTFGMLPYLISGAIPSVTDAFFETVSGMTTTGASIVKDLEDIPAGILFWRSMTQWIGGMGIIVLTVALFPLLGIGGVELFVAEAPGPSADKIHPRIRETAKRLWLIYVGLTVALTVILWVAGMDFYESINHALTTMATGGFSTRNESIVAFDVPAIQYTLALFMFFAGTNYTVIYLSLRGRWKKVWKSDEAKAYFLLTLAFTLVITFFVFQKTGHPLEKAFRDSLFQVVSIVTTTGYVSAYYTEWGNGPLILFFILLFVGACSGSTSGGIKIIRHLVFLKNSILEFKRILHPRAVVPLKLNGQVVRPKIMTHILVFLLLYLILFVAGSVAVSLLGLDFETSIGAVATSLGNVGPGIGGVGPDLTFAWLPGSVKWILTALMLMGRLELFTILVLFTPYFWKSN